jgi:hypothetical protein
VLLVLNVRTGVYQTTAVGPSAKPTSAVFQSDVANRAAIPRYPAAASWPLLRLTF